MTTHHVTITAYESLVRNDGSVYVYRPRCTCRWTGWAVLSPENAQRQRDRHLEQAEIDGRLPTEEPPCTP